ncbi:MAG TPA: ATP-binding protein [Candidatus Deferrimicrobium sp.]|nr:ATP-binding protein [Candidatus Deferrimicrobium sp.]
MKIAKVHLIEHPLFGTMDVDFAGPDGKTLETIVIAGVNGTGKTTLLREIFKAMEGGGEEIIHIMLELDISHLHGYENQEEKLQITHKDREGMWWLIKLWEDKSGKYNEKTWPRIIYLPTEINFEALTIRTLSFFAHYHFTNIVNQRIIEDVPSFIASTINNEVFKNPSLPAQEAIDKVCHEINTIFEILDIDAQMIGLNPEGEKLPIFKNSAGKIFDINHLSSGEKQLFIRAMALRMLNANNSVILIDEPEISMHPGWQQRIVKVYEKIGTNNQVIIATHSPHIVASVPKENIKLLKRVNGQIKVVEYNEISGSYGLPVDIILKELMDLETVRDPEVENEIRRLWDLLHQKQHDSKEFIESYRRLEELLGSEDEELLLIRIEIAKLKSEKRKLNVGNT